MTKRKNTNKKVKVDRHVSIVGAVTIHPSSMSSNGLSQLPWPCPMCTYSNEPASTKCTMCTTDRPPPAPLQLHIVVTVMSASSETTTLQLTDMKPSISVAFLADLIEAKTRIPRSLQRLSVRGVLLDKDSEKRLVDAAELDIGDVIPLTVETVNRDGNTQQSSAAAKEHKISDDMDDEWNDNGAVDDDAWDEHTANAGWEDVEEEDIDNDGDDNYDGDGDGESTANDNIDGDNAFDRVATDDISNIAAAKSRREHKKRRALRSLDSDPADSFVNKSPSSALTTSNPFKIFSRNSIHEHMNEVIADLCEVLGLTTDQSSLLLRAFRWHRQAAIDRYLSDPITTATKAGFLVLDNDNQDDHRETAMTTEFDCPICSDTVPFGQTYALVCGHRSCDDCYRSWIVAEHEKGAVSLATHCLQPKCPLIIPHSVQMHYLPSKEAEKTLDWMTESFVQNRHHMKYCPAPNCTCVAELRKAADHLTTLYAVECNCNFEWCFGCVREDHRPASCDDTEMWSVKNSSESENANWILCNTKKCPKCNVQIEKNQGCDHMTCSRCRYEFCWLCHADWKKHSSCAVYDPTTNKRKPIAEDDETRKIETAKNELQRYLHFYHRWDNHAKSIKFAEKTLAAAQAKMLTMQNSTGTGYHYNSYILDANVAVIRCRRSLQWAHVYAYYHLSTDKDGSAEKALFDQQQAQLEELNNELHELTELTSPKDTANTVRMKTISLTQTVSKFRQNLLTSIAAVSAKRTAMTRVDSSGVDVPAEQTATEADSESTLAKVVKTVVPILPFHSH